MDEAKPFKQRSNIGSRVTRAGTEPHAELVGYGDGALPWGLRLARIGKVMAAAACKDGAAPKIELRNALTTATPIGQAGAPKPSAETAEVAPGPCDRHSLLDGSRLVSDTGGAPQQNRGGAARDDVDPA